MEVSFFHRRVTRLTGADQMLGLFSVSLQATVIMRSRTMGKAWPRFLPEPTSEALMHALIIEAYAIVVEQVSDGLASLNEAHQRALSYAAGHYSPEDIHTAICHCAAAPENRHGQCRHWLAYPALPTERVKEETFRAVA